MGDTSNPQGGPAGSRRDFLKFGMGTAGAAAALAVGTASEAQTLESPEDQVKSRYSRTPHVERFYLLNRL